MLYDLHVHTTASDGTDTPEEVILRALEAGLGGVAITDHDTVNGLEFAVKFIEDRRIDIDFIPGIELNTDYKNDEVHILGYYIDFNNDYLNQRLLEIRNQRYGRAEKIVAKLRGMGISIDFDDVRLSARGNLIGRPHIARVMCQNGYTLSIEEAFEKYIDRGKPAYVPRYKFHPSEAISLIKQSGGLAVLAHPGLIKAYEIIIDVIKMGIDGLETYYPEHSREQIFELTKLAGDNKLLTTGGSDYHGLGSSESRSQLGSAGIDKGIMNRIREYYRENMQK